jgi:membrane protease YdiL (CAAX protease family)
MTAHEAKVTVHLGSLGGIRWRPDSDTLVALGSYIAVVVGLYAAFQVITTAHVAGNFITFGPVTLAGLGIGVPVLYTVLKRGCSLADLGLTRDRLAPSLALGLLLGWDTYRNTLGTLGVTWTGAHLPLIVMALAVGLFEAVFFRGWLQTRFETAFGLVPGLIAAALCYSLYHVGYGMTAQEMLFLFGLGMTFGAFFRLTRSVFVLWPFYTPVGSIFTNLSEGLSLPFDATYGFLLTIGLMVGLIVVAAVLHKNEQRD